MRRGATGYSHLDMRVETVTVNGTTELGVTDLARVDVLDQEAAGTSSQAALMAAAMDKLGVREFRYVLPTARSTHQGW